MDHSEGPRSHPIMVICTDFYRFFRFVVPEYSHMATFYMTPCFFFRIRPTEESPHQTCRTFRGSKPPEKNLGNLEKLAPRGLPGWSLEGPFGVRVARSRCAGQGEKLAPRHHPRARDVASDPAETSARTGSPHFPPRMPLNDPRSCRFSLFVHTISDFLGSFGAYA